MHRKKLLITTIILAVILIAAGFFAYFLKNGKLKSSADILTTAKTYTISGRSVDPSTNAPMVGQTITLTSDTGRKEQVQTDANGNYVARIEASADGLINARQGNGGTEGDTCSFITGSNLIKSCNFNLGKAPFDENELFQDFEKINSASSSEVLAPEPDLSRFDPVVIDGINYQPFVTIKDPKYKPDLTGQKEKIAFESKWLQTLKNATGVADDFPIILVNKVDWLKAADGTSSAGGYMHDNWKDGQPWHSWMVLNISNLYPGVVSHEFGHHIDFVKGYDFGVRTYSSDEWNFLTAFQETVKKKAITGYAISDGREMFAEIFQTVMMPAENDPERLDEDYMREQLGLYIEAYLLEKPIVIWLMGCTETGEYDGCTSQFNGSGSTNNISTQNALMYLYKHVMRAANQDQLFPGEVLSPSHIPSQAKTEVLQGNYMNGRGIISITFADHYGGSLIGSKVTINDNFGEIQGEGYNLISGTVLINGNVPRNGVATGKQKLEASNLPSDYPVPFFGQTLDIKNGANFFPVHFRKVSTIFTIYPNSYPSGSFPGIPDLPALTGQFKTKTGQTLTGTSKGSIPRYPDEGTYGGVGELNLAATKLLANKNWNGTYKALFYDISYIIGGTNDNIYPIEANLQMRATQSKEKLDMPFLLEEADNQVLGIFQKQCLVIQNKPWPWCNPIQ